MMAKNHIKTTILIALAALFVYSGSVNANPGNQGFLGVYPQTIDNDLREAFDLEIDHGVIIKGVDHDSPADQAGIRQGDIILEYDRQELDDAETLYKLVRKSRPGDDIDLVILRKGQKKDITVELGSVAENGYDDDDMKIFQHRTGRSAPQTHSFSKTWTMDNTFMADTYIGVELSSLSDQLGEFFGIEDGDGALISSVMQDSPAETAGLKAGDVIIKIDGRKIEDPSDVQKIVRKSDEGDVLSITVIRDQNPTELSIEVAENENASWFGHSTFNLDDDDFMLFAPKMKHLFRGNFDLDDMFEDHDEDDDDNDDLRHELEELKKELQELREKVDQ